MMLLAGGLDPTGQAGLARDLAVCTHMQMQARPVATCTTVPGPPTHVVATDLAHFEVMLEAAAPGATWMKVGAVPSREHARALADAAGRHGLHVVLDPVLAASDGGRFCTPDDLRPLLDIAHLITPNQAEAHALGLTDGDRVHVTRGGDLPGNHRGTGCRFATRVACLLARGLDRDAAIDEAHRVLEQEIAFDADEQALTGARLAHWQAARDGLHTLLAALRFEHIPEVGTNFAWALPGATDPRDVVGLAGRITIAGFDRDWTGRVAFGGPHHTGRIAVVLQEYAGPADRAAGDAVVVLNHRYDAAFIAAARRGGLVDGSFARADEPEDAPSSMEWGVRHAIAGHGGRVPDLVWDAGGVGKEAMIRVIARDMDDLVRKLHLMHQVDRPIADADGRAVSIV